METSFVIETKTSIKENLMELLHSLLKKIIKKKLNGTPIKEEIKQLNYILNLLKINPKKILEIGADIFKGAGYFDINNSPKIYPHETINQQKVNKMINKGYFDIMPYQPIFIATLNGDNNYTIIDGHHRYGYFINCLKNKCLTNEDKLPYIIINFYSSYLHILPNEKFEIENGGIKYPFENKLIYTLSENKQYKPAYLYNFKGQIYDYLNGMTSPKKEPEYTKLSKFGIKYKNMHIPIYLFRMLYITIKNLKKHFNQI